MSAAEEFSRVATSRGMVSNFVVAGDRARDTLVEGLMKRCGKRV
jgi:hypothetical protein